MEADFDRYYNGRDLAEAIWIDQWPPSKLWARIQSLPEDSAYFRSLSEGHSTLHEILAQVRDAVVTTAHGFRLEGRPEMYQRPKIGDQADEAEALDLSDPRDAKKIGRFFGTHN